MTDEHNAPQSFAQIAESAGNEGIEGLRIGELASAVADINALENIILQNVDDLTKEDWEALRACAKQLSIALQPSERDIHELRNLASALRGYAEMLSESSDALPPEIQLVVDSALASTLEPSTPGESGNRSTLQTHSIASEPGFILAVDDRVENRELLARYLTRSGHFVVTAPGGVEALEMLENADVDVVLLDRMMPEMSGEEVLRKIKACTES